MRAHTADQTPAAPIGSIVEKTKGMKKVDGFFPVYWEESEGRLWLEVPRLDVEVLHVTGFATGLGSNDIGIDRGALSGSRIIKFERVGPRLLIQPNYKYRGTSANAAEVRDVNEAFARSVLWAFPIAAASEDRVLVDFTEFLVRDGGDIAGRLRPGSYRFEAGRSTVYVPMTMGFPKNTEMEAELTFVRQPGTPGGAPEEAAARLPSSRALRRSPPRAKPRASACTTRSWNCPTPPTGRAYSIRERDTSKSAMRISRRHLE
jgi:Domain of unknown function (DUF5117)